MRHPDQLYITVSGADLLAKRSGIERIAHHRCTIRRQSPLRPSTRQARNLMPSPRKLSRYAAAHVSRSTGNKNLPNSRIHLCGSNTIVSIEPKGGTRTLVYPDPGRARARRQRHDK